MIMCVIILLINFFDGKIKNKKKENKKAKKK
jgi:hypothetical protein